MSEAPETRCLCLVPLRPESDARHAFTQAKAEAELVDLAFPLVNSVYVEKASSPTPTRRRSRR